MNIINVKQIVFLWELGYHKAIYSNYYSDCHYYLFVSYYLNLGYSHKQYEMLMIDNRIINFFNNLYFYYIYPVELVQNYSFNVPMYFLLAYDLPDDELNHDNSA